MPKSKLKNVAKKCILIQSRNNDRKFLAADLEYNNLEYKFLTKTCGCLTITSIKINKLNLLSTFSQEAHVIIKSEKNDNGWLNASNLFTQVANKAISIFEATYSNCIGVFAFNNSTNYSAFASNALYTKNMNLYPNDKQSKLYDSWFNNEQNKQIT
ncbi:8337_t:CDS:2 [Cetraspora pellucida]|uniref:8337_t:CDS:1 n=1 Tax=Cetraspora pellucida TaxID=1433469 RepID=A0A9N9A1R3_9GLOM|nr:8337_t:CDS:2 [Cetraspora pellucida]